MRNISIKKALKRYLYRHTPRILSQLTEQKTCSTSMDILPVCSGRAVGRFLWWWGGEGSWVKISTIMVGRRQKILKLYWIPYPTLPDRVDCTDHTDSPSLVFSTLHSLWEVLKLTINIFCYFLSVSLTWSSDFWFTMFGCPQNQIANNFIFGPVTMTWKSCSSLFDHRCHLD